VKPGERGEVFRYELLDGTGEVLQKTTTPPVAENHNTPRWGKAQHSVGEKRSTVLGKTTTKHKGAIAPLENKLSPAPGAGPLLPKSRRAGDGAGEAREQPKWLNQF
jgi:hypothetical protein